MLEIRADEARRADDGQSSGNEGPACPSTIAHSDQYSQILILSAKKAIYQPKQISNLTETPLSL